MLFFQFALLSLANIFKYNRILVVITYVHAFKFSKI